MNKLFDLLRQTIGKLKTHFLVALSLVIPFASIFILFLLALVIIDTSPVTQEMKVHTRYSVPIPEAVLNGGKASFEQELDMFSEQIVRAFNIPKAKADQYAPIIIQAHINTGISEIDIASLIMTESSFREKAKSSVGAYGLTQIRALYWEDFCKKKSLNMYNPKGNILCGAEIVNHLMFKFCNGKLSCALEHYNVGRGNLLSSVKYKKAGKRYTSKIMKYSSELKLAMASEIDDIIMD